jgi:hypothetical protein
MGALGAAAATTGAGLLALGGVAAAGYEAFGLYDDIQKENAKDVRAMSEAAERSTKGYLENEEATTAANQWLLQLADQGRDTQAALLETAMAAREAAYDLGLGARAGEKVGSEIGAGAMDALSQLTTTMNTEFLATGRKLGDLRNKEVNLHMSGATIQVHQDFRDQDPDRVAVLFRRDLGRASVDKIGSAFSLPNI